ncbi:MAG: DMT family transporter [Cryobacterium sp.]|jgi:drug/metabolite transporter (DMT)-like permease|nr:DMT family transporter [Cryobacterium sp.]
MIGGAILALLASAFLGVSDFLGGLLSRKVPLITVLLLSQLVATVAILPRMLWESPAVNAGPALLWGVIGGVATAIAVSSLFKALAIGTMGIVAPITSLSVLVPVIVGLATGDRLSWILAAGLVVAIVGTVLASGPEVRTHTAGHGPKSIVLAIVAAIGFGVSNLSVALGSAFNVTTTLVSNTLVVLVIYGIGAVVLRQVPRARGRSLIGIVAIGILGISANLCFALASTVAPLTIVAVLASLYPVITVLLGWRVLGEHVKRMQLLGVIAVFAGVAAIAASTGR